VRARDSKEQKKMFALTLIVIVLFWALLKWLKSNFKTFDERGVKFEKPVIIFGNMFKAAMGKESVLCTIQNLYDKFYNEK
jgi:tetraacyldisaccharide-1-P 4'-kinase